MTREQRGKKKAKNQMTRIFIALLVFMAFATGDLRGFQNLGGLVATAHAADFLGANVEDREVTTTAWRSGVIGVKPIVANVPHGSLASQVGLKHGDVIIKVGESLAGRSPYLSNLVKSANDLTVLRGMEWMTLSLDTSSSAQQTNTSHPIIYSSMNTQQPDSSKPFVFPQTGHVQSSVGLIAYTPNGNNVLSATGNFLVLWDAISVREIRKYLGHTSPILSIATSSDGKYALSGSAFGELYLWDIKNGSAVGKISKLPGDIYAVTFSQDNKYIVASINNEVLFDKEKSSYTLKIFETKSLKEIMTVSGFTSNIRSISFSKNGNNILVQCEDSVKILDSYSWKEHFSLKESTGEFRSAIYTPNGNYILTVTGKMPEPFTNEKYTSNIKQWDAKTGKLVRVLTNSLATSINISKNGRFILSNDLAIYDFGTGAKIQQFKQEKDITNSYKAIFSTDEKQIVSGHAFGAMKLWDAISGKEIGQFGRGNVFEVKSVAYSPDGKYILSGNRLFHSNDLSESLKLKGHKDRINSVTFSDDGTKVLTGSDDSTLRLWDVLTGSTLKSFVGHSDPVSNAHEIT